MGDIVSLRDVWAKIAHRSNLIFIIGFACAVAWPPALYKAAAPEVSLGLLASVPPHGVCMPSLLASAVTCFLLFFLGKRQNFSAFRQKITPLRLGALMAFFSSLLLAPLLLQESLPTLETCVVAISGVLVVVLYLLWMKAFSKLNSQEMFLTLALSQVLTCAINATLSFFNSYTVLATAIILPLVSSFCLRGSLQHESVEKPTLLPEQEPKEIPKNLWISLALVVFIWGVIDHLFRGEFDVIIRTPPSDLSFVLAYHAAAFFVVVAVIGSIYALIISKNRYRFGHLYRIVFLLGLGSILLLPVALSGQAPILGYACSAAMYQLVFLFMWIIFSSVFRSHPQEALSFFGLMYGFWSLGSYGGALASVLLMQNLATNDIPILIFVATLTAALSYTMVFTEKDANFLVKIVPSKHKAPFKSKCLAVAHKYKLSPRETEIAELIAKGRDSAHIQEKLFLSRSTVQTHRMHIYQKLGIHNRQELLDIIETVDEEGLSKETPGQSEACPKN